jgi:hypothetical protein
MTDATTQDFDWRSQTALRGTVFRVGQIVKADCICGREDVLVYDTYYDDALLCVDCSRARAVGHKHEEMCDTEGCGATPAWRDPLSGKNEFFCVKCHAAHGTVFQNRWAPSSRVLGQHKAVCDAAGYGTDCKGEIKWRGAHKRSLCNKHAGVTSSGPEHHQ